MSLLLYGGIVTALKLPRLRRLINASKIFLLSEWCNKPYFLPMYIMASMCKVKFLCLLAVHACSKLPVYLWKVKYLVFFAVSDSKGELFNA